MNSRESWNFFVNLEMKIGVALVEIHIFLEGTIFSILFEAKYPF